MSWYADEMEFEREVQSRDGEKKKVWLKPLSGADRILIQNRADDPNTEGEFVRDQVLASIIRWELPHPPSPAEYARLDGLVIAQLEDLVAELNRDIVDPATVPPSEEAPADPLPPSLDSSAASNARPVELVS